MAGILAFDTSNYTTSAAYLDAKTGRGANVSRLLPVRQGELGLRQSDAVFAHVKALPEITAELMGQETREQPVIFAASTRPRAKEGSYMPCFLVGEGTARSMASAMGAPFYAFSHQQGHIAAAVYSSGRPQLLERPFLAWHLSGGTTELLFVSPDQEEIVTEEIIGGTTDISAGQLIDRTGVMLGMGFPAGKSLAALAAAEPSDERYGIKVRDCSFSLSGMENQVKTLFEKQASPAIIANFVINTVGRAISRATEQALDRFPGLPVLCSGGVASNERIRHMMSAEYDAAFARPELSTDNAMGVAILAAIRSEGKLPEWTLK